MFRYTARQLASSRHRFRCIDLLLCDRGAAHIRPILLEPARLTTARRRPSSYGDARTAQALYGL